MNTNQWLQEIKHKLKNLAPNLLPYEYPMVQIVITGYGQQRTTLDNLYMLYLELIKQTEYPVTQDNGTAGTLQGEVAWLFSLVANAKVTQLPLDF
jgi:hypothetical protein